MYGDKEELRLISSRDEAISRRDEARKKKDDRRKRRIDKVFAFILGLVIGAALIVGNYHFGFLSALIPVNEDGPTVADVRVVRNDIHEVGELVTGTYRFAGYVEYETGNIPMIDQLKYWAAYEGSLTASVDLTQAQVSSYGSLIWIVIPHARLSEPVVDAASVRYLVGVRGVFADELASSEDAMKRAEKQAKEDDYSEFLVMADAQAKEVLRSLFDGTIEGYDTIVISFDDEGEPRQVTEAKAAQEAAQEAAQTPAPETEG